MQLPFMMALGLVLCFVLMIVAVRNFPSVPSNPAHTKHARWLRLLVVSVVFLSGGSLIVILQSASSINSTSAVGVVTGPLAVLTLAFVLDLVLVIVFERHASRQKSSAA
jgi:hypothetical protein